MNNMNRILNFESYHKIFEADEPNASASAAEQIVGLFYQAYGSMVTKIGDYKDAIDDLLQVAEEKDTAKKGDVMESVLQKVVSKINPEYKSVGNTILEAGKKLKDAYTTLLETEEGKKSTEEINKVIYRKILEFQKGLQTASKEMPKVEVQEIKPVGKDNNSENYEYLEDDINEGLFSKNTFGEERNTIISSLVIFYSDMVAQAKNGATNAIKSKAQEIANNLKKLNDTLGDEKAWADMKRRERKDKLEEIPATIAGYKEDFNKTLMAESTKMGIDKKVAEASVVKSEEKEKEAKAEAEKEKKDDTTEYIEISSGNIKKQNLSKKGPNFDKIKKFQENYNILKIGAENKADGLYGKNTEIAILKAAEMLDGLTGSDLAKATEKGKKMTPEVQAGLQKFLDNKDKIKDLIK